MTLYAVRKPDGTIVQAAPSIDRETALWEAAGRDPTAFSEHLRLTFEDGSQRDVLPSELPVLAARFFARYLGCRDAINTALKVHYGGRK